jgi:hypothetical protein
MGASSENATAPAEVKSCISESVLPLDFCDTLAMGRRVQA